MRGLRRVARGLALVCAALALAAVIAHFAIARLTRMTPPPLRATQLVLGAQGDVVAAGMGFTRKRAGIREVFLAGDPQDIGAAHGALLRERMIENETALWSELERAVPFHPARLLLLDVGRLRYRHIDRTLPLERRIEIAAEAAALAPDPFARLLPSYDRLVLLHSLYDIALSFEHSPLVGCSTFGLGPEATRDGHVLLARAFDFEAGEVFDRDKAVYLVRGRDKIPFASVAWPGLVGVVSGMNAEGVALVVHGGRAREARTQGLPVVFSTRETLERAHDTEEAVAILASHEVMVSHIVIVADAKGRFAVVERAPGEPATVRRSFADPQRIAVTNHFEGPMASDPKNGAVREKTSTLPRRARLDEMLATVAPKDGDVRRAVSMLRDHTCAGGAACELGDRRSIDAFIATHGIVADTTTRTLWVSAGPQLSGPFVAFDLPALFASDSSTPLGETKIIEADPVLADGRYHQGRQRAASSKDPSP